MKQKFTNSIHLVIALLVFLLTPSGLFASETDDIEVQYLVLEQGESVTEFELPNAPVITFSKDTLVVTCNGDTLLAPLAGVTEYRFVTKKVSTGIKDVVVPNSTQKPTIAFGKVSFAGLKSGSPVTVFSIDGRAVAIEKADADGNAVINLSSLPKGIFILHSAKQSIKIINK